MNGFTEVDWTHYRFIIHRNIFDSLKQVLQIGRENFKSFTDDTNKVPDYRLLNIIEV